MFHLNQGIKFVQELNLNNVISSPNICFEGSKRLGYFSFYCNDENERVYTQDKSSLRYLNLPDPIYINCLQGYDPNIKYGHMQPNNANLLRWILENETILSDYSYDFICNNGILKDFMLGEYHGFKLNFSAIKIRGKIILINHETIEREKRISAQPESDNKSTYAAYNLQRLITVRRNDCNFIPGKEDSFFGVFHSKIGSNQILYSGFLDCVANEQELDKPFDDMKFVLIKKFNASRKSPAFMKSCTWWALATLAGIDTVICAKCEPDFTVKNIDKINVDNIINRQRQMIFFHTLNSILNHLRSNVTEENKRYNFAFNGNDNKMIGYMNMDTDENPIPSWYIDGKVQVEDC